MTVSFFDESGSALVGIPTLDDGAMGGSRRFNLRKRESSKMNMSSYNSAFLDDLFADVARVAQSDDEENPAEDASSTTEEDMRFDLTLPVKRSRVSLTKSFSRCARSYKNLAVEVSSPGGVDSFPFDATSVSKTCSPSMERMDSLHFQLNCVDPSRSPKSVKSVVDIIDSAFPHLPATVSDSSCSKQQDLTQLPDQPVSESETSSDSPKESYGWFVDLDTSDDDEEVVTDAYGRSASSTDLAFTAPTAPKRASNYDAEVEWAKAADTIDDVLGDFF